MCVIIYAPNKSGPTTEEWQKDYQKYLRRLHRRNNDGYGIMWADGERVHMVKNPKPENDEEPLAKYEAVKDKDVLVHFRIATHGNIDEVNTHPFQVLDRTQHGLDLWMMHNGILSDFPGSTADKDHSDTWHFVEKFLKPILAENPDLIYKGEFQRSLGWVVRGSKLAFMDNYGDVVLINAHSGKDHKHLGIWTSNEYGMHYDDNSRTYRVGSSYYADDFGDDWSKDPKTGLWGRWEGVGANKRWIPFAGNSSAASGRPSSGRAATSPNTSSTSSGSDKSNTLPAGHIRLIPKAPPIKAGVRSAIAALNATDAEQNEPANEKGAGSSTFCSVDTGSNCVDVEFSVEEPGEDVTIPDLYEMTAEDLFEFVSKNPNRTLELMAELDQYDDYNELRDVWLTFVTTDTELAVEALSTLMYGREISSTPITDRNPNAIWSDIKHALDRIEDELDAQLEEECEDDEEAQVEHLRHVLKGA